MLHLVDSASKHVSAEIAVIPMLRKISEWYDKYVDAFSASFDDRNSLVSFFKTVS